MKNKEITQANLKRVKELLANIQNMSKEEYQELLDSMVKFHNYSFYNQMILGFYGCSQVAGYKKWQELGRRVKKGSKAVWILAPYLKKEIVENEEGKEEETKRLAGFFSVPVFDIADTEGEEIKRGMTTYSGITLNKVKEFAKGQGYVVKVEPLEIKLGGYIKERKIVLNRNLNQVENTGTLIHELIHGELNHNGKDSKVSAKVAEQQAETATYLVCQVLGIERKSEFYLKSWHLSEDIVKDFQKIDKVARKIIKGLTK